MSEIIDDAFIKLFKDSAHSADVTTPILSTKIREFVLSRIRPLIGQPFDQEVLNEHSSLESVRQIICALVAKELSRGKISEEEFWTFMKYENLFNTETRFYSYGEYSPMLCLRNGPTLTPPVIIWRDGTWGWTMLLEGTDVLFGLELLKAGRAKLDPTPYVMRIDAMNRPKGPSATQASKSSGCFIATVCYGDYGAPEVLALRQFRDNFLMPSSTGTAFVRFYYTVAPSLANKLSQHHLVARVIRCVILDPLVRTINALRIGAK
jgi:hypothetical protein